MSLPPALTVADAAHSSDPRVDVLRAPGCDPSRALAFGIQLADAREQRGLLDQPVRVFASRAAMQPPLPPSREDIWAPHLYQREDGRGVLAWELIERQLVPMALAAEPAAVELWARRPEALLRLIELAPRGQAPAGHHLSLRWILANETVAAAALSERSVSLEHVSVHVSPCEEAALYSALVDGLGLVPVARPQGIRTPGSWLQAGGVRVHLNSREPRAGERGFPGTAPNHICFAVADVDTSASSLERAGFKVVRAGSLDAQAWFRLASGTTIELQPLDRKATPRRSRDSARARSAGAPGPSAGSSARRG
jgi:hypothetical protein